MPRPRASALRFGALLVLLGLGAGCSTPGLESARHNYYQGRAAQADATLETAQPPEKDRVLFLMERGTIRQAAGRYEDSAKDFDQANTRLEELQTYSLSKGASSWVVNDNVQNFLGAPYERTLLHAFAAKNYLALSDWDGAGVESRRIIRSLEPDLRGNYPEDAYSRYMAGFGLEISGDADNAAVQYRRATALLSGWAVEESTGRLYAPGPPGPNGQPAPPPPEAVQRWPAELVVFVLIGRAPSAYTQWNEDWQPFPPSYAEIHAGGKLLGRSYNLADTSDLAFQTEKLEALSKTAKTVGRIILKDAIADAVAHETKSEGWGELVRFILFSLEQPDVRRWETLPRWLQVARVPCPMDLESFDVVFKSASGVTTRTVHVTQPITRRRNTFISFCRDIAAR